jgi:hypothetical protein
MRWFPWLFARKSEAATIAHRVHVALTKAEGAMLSKSEARRALAMRDLHKELEIVARAIGYEAEPMSGGLPKDKDPGEKEEPKPDEVQP